jgi:hypothetical protein
MAIKDYVNRGIGPGATIPFYITGGLSIGAAVDSPTPAYRTLEVSAEDRTRIIPDQDRTRVIVD